MKQRNYRREQIGARLYDLTEEALMRAIDAGYIHAEYGSANTTQEAYEAADRAYEELQRELLRLKRTKKI